MLDVDSPSTPRHGSIAGIGVGITSPIQHRKDSTTLDPADPSTWTSPHSSKPNSPTLSRAELKSTRPRGASDASPTTSGHVGLPRTQPGATKGFERDYQFDLSSIPTTGKTDTKRTREGSNNSAMAAALSGDFSNLHVGRPLAASHSHSSGDSRSPSGRIRSPASESSGLLSPTSPPAKLRTAQGTVVDENAHRRLSNKSSSFSTVSDDPDAGQGRVPTDTIPEDDAVESSDEDGDSNASDDDTRGRDRDRKSGDETESPVPDSAKTDDNDSQTPSPAEERKPHATPHSQIIKSMLEPSISVTGPSGEKMSQPSSGVHPESNFDKRRMSTSATSVEDDGEDDIAKAKSLGLNISPLDTKIVDRHVRIIIRGDWTSFQKDPESEGRHNRTYLLCSDLSVEATYALEWTVGTIMRDGDTLLAIYAIEDENAGSPSNSKQPEAERERLHEEGAEAGKAANATMADLTRQTTNREGDEIQSKFIPATEAKSLTGSVDARKVGKKEMDRLKAIDEITQSFLRLVRKTTLQVRCMVEVIHCKSPKHLILGAVSLSSTRHNVALI